MDRMIPKYAMQERLQWHSAQGAGACAFGCLEI
jgi:hypothetical protein